MVGKTDPILPHHRERFEQIRAIGCLPCLLRGLAGIHATVEHITEHGRRAVDQHEHTIGLCGWHHFGHAGHPERMAAEWGASLAQGRKAFEADFGDEELVLLQVQNFAIELYVAKPWEAYNMPRKVARQIREYWKGINAPGSTQIE